MRVYNLNKNDFYSMDGDVTTLSSHYLSMVASCEIPMRQLMEKYGIYNKRVLSIAGGPAFEEYHLAQSNDVTIVDLDENGRIEKFLRSLPRGDDFTYVIGDAMAYEEEPYDVVYISSFVPDEMYRRKRASRRLFDPRVPAKLCSVLGIQYRAWDRAWDPFHSSMQKFLSLVKKPGLFIVQSYATGLPGDGPDFIESLNKFFTHYGFVLNRVYVKHITPNWYLIIASNGDYKIMDEPEIMDFNGRGLFVRRAF